MYRPSVKLLVAALVFAALPGLWAADKDNKVVAIVTDANTTVMPGSRSG
jgi:hypothetical protein